MRISFAELATMSPEDKATKIAELVRVMEEESPYKELEETSIKIAAYEQQYGVSSEVLMREIDQELRQETWDICQWLQLLNYRTYLADVIDRKANEDQE